MSKAHDYDIPDDTYTKLLVAICDEYDKSFIRFATILKNATKERYPLPVSVDKKTTLRMGGINVYVSKAPYDPFDIEYLLEFRLNKRLFVEFINTYMRNQEDYKFEFDNYMYKVELFYDLSSYMSKRYDIKPYIYMNGGYIEFNIQFFTHANTRIIYIGHSKED